jgi:hypothetical protein
MVLDIIGGSVLLAFGIIIIFQTVESDNTEKDFLVHFLIGLAALIAGGWIIFTRIGIALLLIKLAGLIIAAVGFFLTIQFPTTEDYQKRSMSLTGVLMGIFMIIFGVYLLIFY